MSDVGHGPLLEVHGLRKHFPARAGFFGRVTQVVQAVDNVSFSIRRGETLGLVGESGCGKSTIGRTIIRLYDPTEGRIVLDGIDISRIPERELMPHRRKMQMIFQDPYASLNGRMTVADIIGEAIDMRGSLSKRERLETVHELLARVGLNPDHALRYPHEFSGGQRQRIGIARALAVKPEFIICDEPISALDVSIQAQIVNMLEDLQAELGLTYLFIAHDLSMVRHISNRVGVMYLGKLVELADGEELYLHPAHPYTQALLSAIPIPDPEASKTKQRIALEGEVPSPIDPPSGCRFRTRCPHAMPRCAEVEPAMKEIAAGHQAACHLL